MEYQTGVKKKDTLEITELLNAKTGEAVKVNLKKKRRPAPVCIRRRQCHI